MRQLIITGATSFIGRNLISKANNWDIVAVVRRGNKTVQYSDNVRVIELNMDEYANLGRITGRADCFISLAWNGTRGVERMNIDMQRENVSNSIAAIKSVLDTGCRKIVLAGSQAEYGLYTKQVDETTPCMPNTEYGKAKLTLYEYASQLCKEYNVPCIEPRFFSLYGPGDYAGTMIIDTLNKMLADKHCDLTEGKQMWNFMYIDDAISALLMLCERNCDSGVYNFGSEDCRQLRNFVEEMAEITNTKSKLNFGAVPYPSTGMVSIWPNIAKLKYELKWSPSVSFAEGIKSILRGME